MKKIQLNLASAIAVVATGAACAAAGAYIGYGQGYQQGEFNGRHETSRSAVSSVSALMTRGVALKQPDGTAKTYVLQPVESAKN